MPACPVCHGTNFSVLVSSRKLDEECRIRERFVQERLARPASPGEMKDLTDFFHQEKADILACAACSLLVRNQHQPPPAQTYSEDEYNSAVIDRLYPAYLAAFRRKETPFRALLAPGARVVEIGSHYGAFLETAAEWGWQAEGVDIGKETSRYAQSKGFLVRNCDLADCRYSDAAFDGVFVWNCFEQIDNPAPLLREASRILKPGGVLIVRTPNGLFYSLCQELLRDPQLDTAVGDFLIDAMGYNNLLGFPYLYGHSAATLEQLIRPFDFELAGTLNSELLTLPLPQNPEWVAQEEREVNAEIRMLARSVLRNREGLLMGPWVEEWFRKI